MVLAAQRAMAQSDPPGNSLANGQTQSGATLSANTELGAGAVLLDAETKDVRDAAGDLELSLTSEVYTGDSNNLFGSDDLTFRYIITDYDANLFNGDGIGSLADVGATWGNILTDVGENNTYDGGDGGDLATSVSRSAGVITWNWSPTFTPSTDGGVSANLIIETNTSAYENAEFAINDPIELNAFIGIAPDRASTALLFLPALAALVALQRRKRPALQGVRS